MVAAGLADRFEIEVAYAIGIARPLSLSIETFGTGQVPDEPILGLIEAPLRPATRIDHRRAGPAPPDLSPDRRLRPLRPARTWTCPWERTDKAEALAAEAGLQVPAA